MIRSMLAIPLLLLIVALVPAADIPDQFQEDGYTYHVADAYWWKAGIPYSREKKVWYERETRPYYGTYFQAYFKYIYTPVPNYQPPVPSYTDPYWRNKLTDMLATEQAQKLALENKTNEQNMWLEAIQALGLDRKLLWQNYGGGPKLANPLRQQAGNLQFGNYGASGNSIYGYRYDGNGSAIQNFSYNKLIDAYGTDDPNIRWQQFHALAKLALEGGHQLGGSFGSAVVQSDQSRADVLKAAARLGETLAKGQAAAQALQAASPAPSMKTTITESGTIITPGQPVQPVQPLTSGGFTPRQQQAIANCVQCHSGQKISGGYDVTRHWSYDAARQAEAVQRMLLPESDPKFMPKGGRRVNVDLIAEFMPRRMPTVP